MVAEGLPNKLIARRLEISEATVKAHLTRIFERLRERPHAGRPLGPAARTGGGRLAGVSSTAHPRGAGYAA